jgi:hypothetical protein
LPPRSTIRRTGWLLTPSTPVTISTCAGGLSAAALVPGAGDEVAEPHVLLTSAGVGLVQHPYLAAALALDAQEPGREGA